MQIAYAYGKERIEVRYIVLASLSLIAAQVFFFSLSTKVVYSAAPIFDATASLPFAESTNKSLNWSGYVANAGEYTAVSGTWIVPSIAPSQTLAADATWIGIGGVDNKNLLQIGTQAVADEQGGVTYQAWVERLPESSQALPLVIHENDIITASVTETAPNIWKISMLNETTHKSYESSVTYNSNRASAEWIEEIPSSTVSLQLSNFSPVRFIKASAIKNGQVLEAQHTGAHALSLVNSKGISLAAPSIMGSDGAFRIERKDTN